MQFTESLQPINGGYMNVIFIKCDGFGLLKMGKQIRFVFGKASYVLMSKNEKASLSFYSLFKWRSHKLLPLKPAINMQVSRSSLAIDAAKQKIEEITSSPISVQVNSHEFTPYIVDSSSPKFSRVVTRLKNWNIPKSTRFILNSTAIKKELP